MRRRKLGETGRKKMIQLIYILITELPIYPKKWMVRSFLYLIPLGSGTVRCKKSSTERTRAKYKEANRPAARLRT